MQALIQAVRAAEKRYAAHPTQGPGSTFAAVVSAAEALAGTSGERPQRCMHHTTFPDSVSGCHGEPSDYCETAVDLGRRLAAS